MIDTSGQEPSINLSADVGGGCNVSGVYQLDVTSEIDDREQVVTINGHDYESDDEDCTDLAEATATVPLDPGVLTGEVTTLRFELDGQQNVYNIVVDDQTITINEQTSTNVTLSCLDPNSGRRCLL